ncbi:hypothetical protein [Streptomyces sirii]|uniref:hypothetical protein n=1 Tax=Streptomyces sirii TaxID=3127701 RepID=UPI003D361E35
MWGWGSSVLAAGRVRDRDPQEARRGQPAAAEGAGHLGPDRRAPVRGRQQQHAAARPPPGPPGGPGTGAQRLADHQGGGGGGAVLAPAFGTGRTDHHQQQAGVRAAARGPERPVGAAVGGEEMAGPGEEHGPAQRVVAGHGGAQQFRELRPGGRSLARTGAGVRDGQGEGALHRFGDGQPRGVGKGGVQLQIGAAAADAGGGERTQRRVRAGRPARGGGGWAGERECRALGRVVERAAVQHPVGARCDGHREVPVGRRDPVGRRRAAGAHRAGPDGMAAEVEGVRGPPDHLGRAPVGHGEAVGEQPQYRVGRRAPGQVHGTHPSSLRARSR